MRNALGMSLPLALLAAACATNRLDHAGDRQGRWRTYYDAPANRQPQSVGHFRHGQATGRWRYYAPDGHLDRRERFQRGGYSRLTFYQPSGRVWRQGHTRIADNGRALHYYWTGDWLMYGPDGHLQRVDTYEQGHRVSTRAGLHQPPVAVHDTIAGR